MAKPNDVERLSLLIVDEFSQMRERFDAVDQHFDALERQLAGVTSELIEIRRRLDALEEAAGNVAGFAKEIHRLLQRVSTIEKHLGLNFQIKA